MRCIARAGQALPLRGLNLTIASRLEEGRNLAPAPGEDERLERFPAARGEFAFAQFFRELFGIARIAEGESGDRLKALRDRVGFADFVGQDSGHLMDEEAARDGFNRELGRGEANVVPSVAIRVAIVPARVGDGDHERGRVLAPCGVARDEALQHAVEFGGLLFAGDEVVPRLAVVRRGRPARGFEQAAENFRLDGAVGEGARAPAAAKDFVNRVASFSKFFHFVSLRTSREILIFGLGQVEQ